MKVVLNDSSKSPALCILRSEMCVLVTTSNARDPEGNKEYPDKALCCELVYGETCIILIYIVSMCEARDSQSSLS